MILSFFKKKDKQSTATDQKPEEIKEEVKRLIERINTSDDEHKKPGK